MKLKVGEILENIKLPNIDGNSFELESLKGKKVLISFHRFATCPFCNLHIHQLVKNFDSFADDFAIVAIFDSPLNHLQTHAESHHAPFAILADDSNVYYQRFNVERSVLKTIKGFIKRFPTLIYAMFIKGYWPFPIKGNIFSMPLEILLDRDGRIEHIHKGKDEGDHIPLEDIKNFSKYGSTPIRGKDK
ncbi:peroxiredoxin-like family protein [Thalassotalea atypica]|uniref:peroxiredoxin-like family protein n=1 Tax=Thalassotalea atypica TaxID=2054316 RepID=UPI0025725A76|nr:peroxiredoxin-like family protein [Thalassotalea atypica]